jgi:ABC-type multidrug transport system ATPase subunit
MKKLNLDKIDFAYNKSRKIFQDFSISFESIDDKGQVSAIMGTSGSGKTTLLKLLLGIESPQKGTIKFYPENPVISYVPQEPVLFEHLSITDNARYFSFAGIHKNRFNENLFQELVKSLGLVEVINNGKNINELSGGQKQRLSLLRALCINPDFLLLDEPCNGLDAEVKRSFLNKLREITERYKLFVLYITHHKLEAQLIADNVVYLQPDKNDNVIKFPVMGSITDFMNMPPVLEAAKVFRFPDTKILPIIEEENGIRIATSTEEPNYYYLINEDNLKLGDEKGFKFKVTSRSPVYTVLRNEEANIEWMVATNSLNNNFSDEYLYISTNGSFLKYNNKGFLIK